MSYQTNPLCDVSDQKVVCDYQTPDIIFEADLQTRAGSPLTGPTV